MPAPADRFDEVRRKWIARHQHTFIFQKRRAEILARQIRDRAQENTGARVDPADDDIIHPMWARSPETIYAAVDWVIVLTVAVFAPIGWAVGRGIYAFTIQLIPENLRSYPIAAFMWSAVAVGVPLPVIYWLVYSGSGTFASTVVAPWVVAQVPAALLAAGVYGILEGWLAVDGSRDWWPMRPPQDHDEVDFGFHTEIEMLPSVFRTRSRQPVGERTPIKRDRDGL